MKTIHELYEYRTMIGSMIRRDLRGRYKGSALGFAWTFLNPLLQLAVYTLVFSMIMRAGIKDYYLFLFVALIPWIFFSTSVSAGASCIMAQKDIVKKIYFPREVLPISHVTCQLVNMLLSMVVVLAVLLLSGKGISFKAILYLPPVIVAEYLLALSITMIVSAVTVYLRDLEHVLVIITINSGYVFYRYGAGTDSNHFSFEPYDTNYYCIPGYFILSKGTEIRNIDTRHYF